MDAEAAATMDEAWCRRVEEAIHEVDDDGSWAAAFGGGESSGGAELTALVPSPVDAGEETDAFGSSLRSETSGSVPSGSELSLRLTALPPFIPCACADPTPAARAV